MNRDLFNYLRELNLTDDQINYIEENNQFIYNTSKDYTKKVLNKIREKGITDLEIKDMLIKNIYLVSESLKRIEKLENIYINILNLSNEEIKYLLLNNYKTYTINPTELNNVINYWISLGYTKSTIKKFILDNPSAINYELKDVKKDN